jgi:hypothetical protein
MLQQHDAGNPVGMDSPYAYSRRRQGEQHGADLRVACVKLLPSPPEARWAMLPPPVPTLARAGIVVSALLGGVKRRPSTLIRPPAGVANSIVPRLFAVGS